MQSPSGQRAFELYKKWIKAQKKATNLLPETFIRSRFFMSFGKFVEYCRKMQITAVDTFIRLMVMRDIPPTIWVNAQVYQMFVEFLELTLTPMQQVDMTVKTLMRCADAADTDVSNVFTILTAGEIITLLQRRKISPWVLLMSKKFKSKLINDSTVEQRIILETIIRPDFWHEKFSADKDQTKKIKEIVAALDL